MSLQPYSFFRKANIPGLRITTFERLLLPSLWSENVACAMMDLE